MTVKVSQLREVIKKVIDKRFNHLCAKTILTGEESTDLYRSLVNQGNMYLTQIILMFEEEGIEVEIDDKD